MPEAEVAQVSRDVTHLALCRAEDGDALAEALFRVVVVARVVDSGCQGGAVATEALINLAHDSGLPASSLPGRAGFACPAAEGNG
eukprot:3298037-Prymnesium_polylepis.2